MYYIFAKTFGRASVFSNSFAIFIQTNTRFVITDEFDLITTLYTLHGAQISTSQIIASSRHQHRILSWTYTYNTHSPRTRLIKYARDREQPEWWWCGFVMAGVYIVVRAALSSQIYVAGPRLSHKTTRRRDDNGAEYTSLQIYISAQIVKLHSAARDALSSALLELVYCLGCENVCTRLVSWHGWWLKWLTLAHEM